MRTASPQKTHRPKDLATIEQAEYIANLVATRRIAEDSYRRSLRGRVQRVVRALKKATGL